MSNFTASAAPTASISRGPASSGALAAIRAIVHRYEDFARRRPLWFSGLVVACLFATVFATLSTSYQTNDDPQLAMIAAGKGIALQPDEHLIFSNVLVGQVLKWLYSVCPALPWYGIYLFAIQFVAEVAILYCAIARGYGRGRMSLYLMYFAIVGVFYLNNLQYTTTASLAGQAGALLCCLAFADRGASLDRKLIGRLAGGVALLALASLVRLECFYLVVLLAMPAVAWAIGWPPATRMLFPVAAAGAICVAMVVALASYHTGYFARDPDWQAFLDYNKLRVKFNDYGWTTYNADTAPLFAAASWSENDHALIEHWFYDHPATYSAVNLQKILASRPWRSERFTPDYVRRSTREIWRDKSLWPIVLAFPLFLWALERSRRNSLALAITVAAGFALLAGLTVLTKSPPSRVYFPVLTFPLTLALSMAREKITFPRRRMPALSVRCFLRPRAWRRPGAQALLRPTLVHCLVLAAIIGTGMSVHRQHRRSAKAQQLREELRDCLAHLEGSDQRLYVSWATDFPWVALSPLDSLSSLGNRRLLMMSWTQGTPIAAAMKERFGIADTTQALFTRPDVVLLGDATSRPLIERFVREHHGVEVRFAASYIGGHEFDEAGRFEPSPPATIATAPEPPVPATRR